MNSQTINWEGYLTIEVPDGWEASEEDGVITVYDENGVGALQASFIKTPATVALDDLEKAAQGFIDQLGLSSATSLEMGSVAGTPAMYFAGSVRGEWWRVWYFGKGHRMCCLTYNCTIADAVVEDSIITDIVARLELDF